MYNLSENIFDCLIRLIQLPGKSRFYTEYNIFPNMQGVIVFVSFYHFLFDEDDSE